MTNQIAISEHVVKSLEASGFNRNTIENYKNLFAKGASDDELIMFMRVCKATDLSPEKRQIYCVPRYDSKLKKNVYTPQTSVDGLRSIAERSGQYEGQTAAFWCGTNGEWKDIWIPTATEKNPYAAKIGIYKKGCREPIYGVARWDSYVQKYYKDGREVVGPMWTKMGDVMIAKCAESLALRKAFPNESHGLYTKEEMEQAETSGPRDVTDNETPAQVEPAKPATNFKTEREASLNARLQAAPSEPVRPSPSFDKFQAKKAEERFTEAEGKNIKPEQPKEVGPVARGPEKTAPPKPSVAKVQAPEIDEEQADIDRRIAKLQAADKKEIIDAHLGDEVPDFETFSASGEGFDSKDEKPIRNWGNFVATAGKYTGKSMKEIQQIAGSMDKMKIMLQKGVEKMKSMHDEAKEVPQTVVETLSAMESYIIENA